jgi:hypothetical protein
MIERRTLLVSAAAIPCSRSAPAQRPVSDGPCWTSCRGWKRPAGTRWTATRLLTFGDDALLITVDGTRFTKAGYIAALAETNLQGFTIGPNPVLLRYSADVAAIVYAVTYSARPAGGAGMTLSVLATSVFARRDGRWVSVHYQETPGR